MQRIPPTKGHVARPWNDYLHPRNRTGGYRHAGVDIKANGRVVAPTNGVVTTVALERGYQWQGYGPWVIVISSQFHHLLAHLRSVMVRQGQRVEAGEPIGTIDPSIGHVHWEVRAEKTREPNPWQKTIDPIGWLENKQISHYFVSGKTPLRNGYPLNVGEKMAFEDPKKILDRQFQQWKSEAEASAQKVETGDNKSNWQSIALIGGGLALAYLMLKK